MQKNSIDHFLEFVPYIIVDISNKYRLNVHVQDEIDLEMFRND